MKSISQFFDKPLTFSLLLFLFFSVSSFLIVEYFTDRSLDVRTEAVAKKIRTTLELFFKMKEEAIYAYYERIALDRDVIDALHLANSQDEEERKKARVILFRHLSPFYEYLRENGYIYQLNFILPDNTFFIRFHSPELYGDDARLIRNSIVKVNSEKNPVFGFELGKIATGYRFVFPVFDQSGRYLGVLDMGVGLSDLMRAFAELSPGSEVYLLIRGDLVQKKVSKTYQHHFLSLSESGNWMIECPDKDTPPAEEKYRLIRVVAKRLNLEKYLDEGRDITLPISLGGNYYEVTLISMEEIGTQSSSAYIVYLQPSETIQAIMDAKNIYFFSGVSLSFITSLLLYLVLKNRRELAESYKRLETITSSMSGGVVVYDREGRVTFVNDSALEMLGYERSELLSSVFHDLVHYHTGPLEKCPIYRAVVEGKEHESEDSFIRKDGSPVSVYIHVKPLFLKGERVGGLLSFYDITERKRREEELFRMATTDHLTGLYNRRFVESLLRMAEDKANNRSIPFSLIMIDIDNFKRVNDTCSHAVGDLVLVEVARVLKESLRFPDISARWGGEEFLVLLDSTELESAIKVAERLREKVEELTIGNGLKITISLGVAQHRRGDSYQQTIEKADYALYEAKRGGKNRVAFYREQES